MKDTFSVNDLPVYERPRERLIKFGVESMSAQELLAVILGRGVQGESVFDIVRELFKKYGTLEKMALASLADLDEIKGVGQAKATQIKAVFELARRLNEEKNAHKSRETVKSPQDVVRIIGSSLKDEKREHFLIITLDTRNHLIETHTISIGSLDSSIVHPREVFHPAIMDHAASVILIHNHPSGNPEPSEEDTKLTKQLLNSGQTLGIEILDHIIVGDNSYFSMKDRNLI